MSSILDELENENDSDNEGQAMTAADVLKQIEQAWLNEKFAPNLLENKMDLVECMLEQIAEMEENFRRAKKGEFKVCLYSMEVDRIKYILSSYLRCRLEKIEKYAAQILEEEATAGEDEPSKLSPDEFTFAKEYAGNLEHHLQSLALQHMPQNLQAIQNKEMMPQQYVDKYVFLRVNESIDGVLVEEETLDTGEEIVDLETGDQHIMRYRPMMPHVNSGAVSLI